MSASDWSLSIEIMCDVSDFAIGSVLGHHHEKIFQVIYYVSCTLNEAQETVQLQKKKCLSLCSLVINSGPKLLVLKSLFTRIMQLFGT